MEAHFCKLIEHHIDDMVAVAEMVVEADGHAVAQARQANGILQRGDDLVLVVIAVANVSVTRLPTP